MNDKLENYAFGMLILSVLSGVGVGCLLVGMDGLTVAVGGGILTFVLMFIILAVDAGSK